MARYLIYGLILIFFYNSAIIAVEADFSKKPQENDQTLTEIKKNLDDQKKEIELIKSSNTKNLEISSTGAIILLVGLLMELLGALLLGAPALSAKMEELNDLEIKPGWDLLLHTPDKERVLSFYVMIGHITLFLGFLAQFVGTAIVLTLNLIQQTILVLVGVLFGFLILYWLLGIDPAQSRRKKLSIVTKNIKRILTLKLSIALFGSKGCDVCLKGIARNNAFILWYDGGNTKHKPYANPPKKFFVGHLQCLERKKQLDIESVINFEQRAEVKPYYYIAKGDEFLRDQFLVYKKWFEEHYNHWITIRSDTERLSFNEREMNRAVKKINKLK